ncbi:hypothetical protein SK128_011348 [Halocaridina rubra]|uniref:Phosphatidic acid phosphatase type 2/haloperoxidase domain-containing protein n=1 Tax=Halocaridina rubra TaxID=373956 RepID=A0AAN8XCN9_HALRR
MTSETMEKEEKNRVSRRFSLRKHKKQIGLICGASLTVTLLGFIPPLDATVSCSDDSIRLPYLPDTISVAMLLTIALLIPFITMTITEYLNPPVHSYKNYSLGQCVRTSWHYIGDLFVGGLFMFVINDFMKIFTSEARPSFWSSCSPDVSNEQCRNEYITVSWKDCTNPYNLTRGRLVDSMKSFPSGHASVSVYSSLFMIVYIKERIWKNGSLLIAVFMQLTWVGWTYLCCQSRIWDNRHHWWDILVGAFLGAFGTLFTLNYFSNWFIRENYSQKPGYSQDK